MLQKAIRLATAHHNGQFRKHVHNETKIPFVVHPLEVMKTVWDWGVDDETVLVAAVCHDLVEDTAITPNKLKIKFSEQVATIVDELTFRVPKNKMKKAEAKAQYIATFDAKSIEALVVKLADRVCNIHDFIRSCDFEYAAEYFKKALPLFEAFRNRHPEITTRFGNDVLNNMSAEITILFRQMSERGIEC